MLAGLLFDGFILLTLIFLLVVSFGYPYEVKLLPLIFIPLAIILLSVQIVTDLIRRKKGRREKKASSENAAISKRKRSNQKPLKTILSILGLFAGLYFLGFTIAAPAFTIFILRSSGESWRTAVGSSVIFWVVFFAVFMYALKVQIYPGMIYLTVFG